jgi:HEAT repeat protein
MALADDNPDVRISAADALGRMKEPAALEHLEKALNDEDIWVQCAAMKAIDLIAPERILTIAKRIHTQAGGLLMITCLQLLEHNPDPEARSIVRNALESTDSDIVMQASKSLERSLATNN